MVDLSIIIVNYNTFSLTCSCIKSVYEKTHDLTFEIILVDNASSEVEATIFLQKFPDIILVVLKKNQGFGRGNNEGIKRATGKVLLLLNSDTYIFDNALKKTYDFLLKDKEVGLVGCKLLNEDGTEQSSSYIPVNYPLLNLFINGNPFLHKVYNLLGGQKFDHVQQTLAWQKRTHVCEAVSGAFMMLRREVLDTCGPFDPDFFMYSEEIEWCKNRISKHFKILYFAEASVIHYGGKSSDSIYAHKQGTVSSFLYSFKRSYVSYFLTILIYIFNTLSVVVSLPLLRKELRFTLRQQIGCFFGVMYHVIFDIPFSGRAFGSRENPLTIREYRNN